MEEEIELSYLEHEIENNQELCLEYLMDLKRVDLQYCDKREERIKELKRAKFKAYLLAGAVDACNFMAAVSILNASKLEYPVIDAFLVPVAFTGSLIAMSHRSRDAIKQEERNFKIKMDELDDEYTYYGDKYIDECIRITDECIDLQAKQKALVKTLETNERISQ